MKYVVTSGGFDPLHIGHIKCFQASKKLGDYLIVILNTDKFLKRKKGFAFLPLNQRKAIIRELKSVDEVVVALDKDQTVCKTIKYLYNKGKCDIFSKGGDRSRKNTPELDLCKELGIGVKFGVGGGKIESSSWLIEKACKKLK